MIGTSAAIFLLRFLTISQPFASTDDCLPPVFDIGKTALPVDWIVSAQRDIDGPSMPPPRRAELGASSPDNLPTGHPTFVVRPEYPQKALKAQIDGYVDFEFKVMPDGSVANARITAEIPDGYGFAAAAEKVFQQWKFKPTEQDGIPVARPAKYRVVFHSSN